MMKPRKYFPHAIQYGYSPAYVENNMMMIGLYKMGVSETLDACAAECERLNREQVRVAEEALARATEHMAAIREVFGMLEEDAVKPFWGKPATLK